MNDDGNPSLISGFHTTMVLTQPITEYGIVDPIVCFHTTMVLTQRGQKMKRKIKALMFPYHYGSHATYRNGDPRRAAQLCFHTTMVLTQPYTLCICVYKHKSFHTTMVLTQRNPPKCRNLCVTTFPYHYGSHATRDAQTTTLIHLSRFHTTMVLTQRSN